jgi:UDP-GlcNAc:undecaprenyl-phosphate GlcNAc-1-phosphate transferase
MRPASAVLTIHLATMMTGLGGLLLYKVADWTGALLVLSLILCILCIIAILETVGRHSVAQMQEQAHSAGAAGARDPHRTSDQTASDQ